MKIPMRRIIKWGIPVTVILLVVVYGFISSMIVSGITEYERKDQEEDPMKYGLQFEEVEFVSRYDKITLNGWYIQAEDNEPTIIFIHGIGSMRSGNNAVELASNLVESGYSVLLFDLRAHGSSGGDQISGGYFEQRDLLGAYDFLISRGIPSDKIGVIGFSMGAGTAVIASVEEPNISALVIDSPYAKVSDLITSETARKTVFPEWITPIFIPGVKLMATILYGIDVGALTPEEAVQQLSYPIFVIHGMSDTRIPYQHGERVHQHAHPESTIWLVPEVDHVDSFQTHPEEYVQKITDYFNRQLNEN